MFTLNGGKTYLPVETTPAVREIQDKTIQTLMEWASVTYQYYKKKYEDGTIKGESYRSCIRSYLDDYQDEDVSSKMIFLIHIVSMNDAEGRWYDMLVQPFASKDIEIIKRGCEDIMDHVPHQIEKTRKLLQV